MPVDDPGWGDYVPPPAEPGQPQQPTPPAQPAQPEAQPQTQPQPSEREPAPGGGGGGGGPLAGAAPRLALAGVVVAALAVGGFFLFSGGDSEETGDERPAAVASEPSDDAGSSIDPSPDESFEATPSDGASPSSSPRGEPLSTTDYIAEADLICSAYAADIEAASQANDLQALAEVDQAMLDELRTLTLPRGRDGDVIYTMLSDFQVAIDALRDGRVRRATQFASAAQTTAVQMGFGACAE